MPIMTQGVDASKRESIEGKKGFNTPLRIIGIGKSKQGVSCSRTSVMEPLFNVCMDVYCSPADTILTSFLLRKLFIVCLLLICNSIAPIAIHAD